MRRSTPFLLLVLLIGTAQADIYELNNGKVVQGGTIGEADGVVHLLTKRGNTRRLARADIASVDTNHQCEVIAGKLARRLKKLRAKFTRKRQKAARKLLRGYERADATERERIEAALNEIGGAGLIKALEKTLQDGRSATRQFAFQRLEALRTQPAVFALVRSSIVGKRSKVRAQAYRSAVRSDRDLTRRTYEAIAGSNTHPRRRVAALNFLAGMGERSSVPKLIWVVERVEMEIRAELVKADNLRKVPVNLGTAGGAAINVPIELPETSVISVSTKITVTSMRRIGASAVGALKAITNEDFGADAGAWRNWWNRQPKHRNKN